MIKRNLSGLRPLLYAITLSVFSLTVGACNQTPDEPDLPVLTDTPDMAVTSVPTEAPASTDAPDGDTLPKETGAVVFSKKGGFYDASFYLTLTSADYPEIYYTTDGSDPRTSDTALCYADGILIYDNTNEPNVYSAITDITLNDYYPPSYPIDKGIVIRAVAKASDGAYSEVFSNSYFIGKTASYYNDLKVISMVTDSDYLFDPDNGAYMVGSGYYAWKDSSDYAEYDPSDVQNPTNYNADGKESEFPVTIQVFENGTSVYTADIGARISGNWSRSSAQKSLRLYARKEYGTKKLEYEFFEGLTGWNGTVIDKFDKITLRNGGNDAQVLHFRDALIQDLAKGLALDYMASEPYLLFINGEFWGFYLLREKPEDYYIHSHYGIDEKEIAVIKNGGLDSGTEEDLGDYWNFCNWAATADMTLEENYKEFCSKMDVQSFMDYMTVETYVNNSDWATGYMNNWIVWRSSTVNPDLPKADGKWRFILYDLDITAGIWDSTENSYRYDSLNTIYSYDSSYNLPAILHNLCRNPEFLQAFRENYLRIISDCFDPDTVNATIDAYATAYEEATKATYHRFGMDWAADNYENELERLRNFFHRRPGYASRYLDAFCGAESEQEFEEALSENLAKETSSWSYYGDATVSADPSDNSFRVTTSDFTENAWDIQSQTPKLTLEKGAEYKLTFEASLVGDGKLTLNINRQDGDSWPNCFWADADASEEIKTFEYYFTMDHDTHDDWKLCFNYGEGMGDFFIQNVVLARLQ